MKLAPVVAAWAICAAGAASAAPLLAFTDTSPTTYNAAFLSDSVVNWAGSWTQSVSTFDVTLSAVLSTNIRPAVPASWYVTTRLGPGTLQTDVVHSGTYTAADLTVQQLRNFDEAPRTVLGSGLAFAPGTYYLVLDGPPGRLGNNADWIGNASPAVALAPGFSLGSYYSTLAPDAFAPAGAFAVDAQLGRLVFEMDGTLFRVPVPSTLLLLGIGFAALGLTRRSSRQPAAA